MEAKNDGNTLTSNDGGEGNLASSDRQSAEGAQGQNKDRPVNYKVFCDSVHGQISLHPLLVKITDTPQFQRMRNIKQLGSAYFVYPGASHNRFEHSIGTAYLAGELARTIQRKQSGREVSNTDVLCVEIAGLCFSLGYGPFSYLYKIFLKRVINDCKWKRKEASCKMLEHLIDANDLWPVLNDYEIGEDEIKFVKEMIMGSGSRKDKSCLYEIVSNRRNRVDVVKWDYIARDCHHLGFRNSFDHNRFLKLVEVLPVNKFEGGQILQICARDKECENLYEMFHMRSVLHRRAYQHRVAKTIDCMIVDAMELADPHIKIHGKIENGKTMMQKISQCIDDPVAYSKLTDGIFERILYSTEPDLKLNDQVSDQGRPVTKSFRRTGRDLKEAREILDRVLRRQLYKLIGVIKWSEPDDRRIWLQCVDHNGNEIWRNDNWEKDEEELLPGFRNKSEIVLGIVKCDTDTEQLQTDDLASCVKIVDYGMKDKNPIMEFKFFNKSEPHEPKTISQLDVSVMLAKEFQEKEVLLFCKDENNVRKAKKCFSAWCKKLEQNASSAPSAIEEETSQSTPSSRPNASEPQTSREDSDTPPEPKRLKQ